MPRKNQNFPGRLYYIETDAKENELCQMTHFCVLCPQKIQLLQRVTGRIVTSKQMACVTCNQQHNSVWHDISKRATPLLLLFEVKPIAKCYFQLMCEMDSFSQGNNIFALNATTMVFTTHIKYPVSQ